MDKGNSISAKGLSELLRRFSSNEQTVLILMGILIGLLGGLGAVGFRWLVDSVTRISFSGTTDMLESARNVGWWRILLVPTAGGLLVGPLVYFFAREARGNGVPEVMEAVAKKGGMLRPRLVVVKALASALTIGTGGSVGREGPIVLIGSAFGSSIGRLFKLSRSNVRILVGCGAAAGIAATFNAPIAGAMFALEIILGDWAITTFSPIVISSVMATVVSRAFLGDSPTFLALEYQLQSGWEIPNYFVLGILSAIVGVVFIRVLFAMEDKVESIKIPEYLKAAVGGGVIGAIGIGLPHLLGNGYETIELVLRGQIPLKLVVALLVIKIFATSITLTSGGSGGIFAPSLFIGAMLGILFGNLSQALFPEITSSPGAYCLVGMASMVAATTHAPLSAIIILFELTGDYKIILPLMISCNLASIVSAGILKESIYTMKLVRRGVNIREGKEVNILKGVTVYEAMTRDVITVPEDMHFKELMELFTNSKHISFPVVDPEGLLSGVVTLEDFRAVVFETGLDDLVVVKELATTRVITVFPDEDLHEALEKIGTRNIEHLPVVSRENPRRLVGILSHRDIISAYNNTLLKKEELPTQDGGLFSSMGR